MKEAGVVVMTAPLALVVVMTCLEEAVVSDSAVEEDPLGVTTTVDVLNCQCLMSTQMK